MSKIRHKHLLPICIIVFSLLIALRLALSSEVKSSIRILARLGMPIESQDLPQITSLRPKAHIVKIIEQHVQPGLPSQQRNPEISDDHIIISAVDAEKNEIFRVNQIDPRLIRAEWEDSPGFLTTNNFYLNEVDFGIALPNNHNIKNLEIYQVHWTGTDMRMELLGDAQLAQMTISSYMYPTESVSPIRYNGDPANRVDLVILGDGYTQNELAKFSSNAETAVNGLFDENPFQEYSNFFNVLRVDVISNESGADHPSKEIYKDTALDATYGTGGTIRALTVNKSKVEAILENNIPANQRDLILVIVNDTEYGGTGGSIAVASIHPSCIELVLHELGHSFGLLGDEYTYGGTNCDNPFEPNLPNVTTLTERNKIKWNVGGGPPSGWIELDTPIPTTNSIQGIPGLYEGAFYCSSGYYRPTYMSKMRALNQPFQQINEEQLVKRVYNWVSPIDSFSPTDGSRKLVSGEVENFQVMVPQPYSHSLKATWSMDGNQKGTGSMFALNSTDYNLGVHTLDVKVEDPTSRVRNDPALVLIDSHSWEIIIIESILAPLGFNGNKVINRSLSQAEYINVLTWQKNPANKRIVKYRIYQLIGDNRQLISEIDLGVFEFWHRNVEKTKAYNYCIVAVNDFNIEGIPAYATIQ